MPSPTLQPSPTTSSRRQTQTAGETTTADDAGAAIVRNIASFLSLSDATSIVSVVLPAEEGGYTGANFNSNNSTGAADSDSWAVGEELLLEQLNTPATPALIAVSPGGTPFYEGKFIVDHKEHNGDEDDEEEEEEEYELEELLQERKRRWAQERLAAAVFAHPQSIRSYCVEAYSAATEIRNQKEAQQQQQQQNQQPDPETHREPPAGTAITKQRQQKQQPSMYYHPRHRRRRKDLIMIHNLVDALFHNIPLSVLLDLTCGVVETYFESVHCTIKISVRSIQSLIAALSHIVSIAWDGVVNFNPFAVLDAIISLQVNAMGKTSEVLASGIQSVATGVGSASSMALHRLSRGTGVGSSMSANKGYMSSLGGNGPLSKNRGIPNSLFQKKLLRKVSNINSAAEVISYREFEDDTGGLSRHAKSRVQRMMHYDVSLRPFVATIAMPPGNSGSRRNDNDSRRHNNNNSNNYNEADRDDGYSSSESTPMDSPFMCTPQSFPPTPASRTTVLARSTRFADDVIFLARDQLRVHDALASENERTREMARALSEGKRLAVFDAKDAGNGIELTCGQHLATKVGNMLYCSARSMVPVLRNCYVYFEMTVMPRPMGNVVLQASAVTLSIGLSTEEMPHNTLVGAWSGSVGLCTTGQILTAGQWCSPVDPTMSSYGDAATIGCLVCLDDGSAFETWDGVMVTAQVTFNGEG